MSDYFAESPDEGMPLFSRVNTLCVIEKTESVDDEEYSKKRDEIIQALKHGGLTCIDVEQRWHRGQAVIGDLRKRGHIIHTVRGVYVYEGFRGDMVKAKPLQELYYQTSHWRKRARERKDFDGWECVQCHAKDELEAHHWRYDLFNESLFDLATLCKRCHAEIHDCVKGSSVHWPTYVTREIAKRIQQG